MPTILKKLRLKFMLMTTGIVAILVIVIAGVYCLSIYSSISAEIDIALSHAVDNSGGKAPEQGGPAPMPPEEMGEDAPTEDPPPEGSTDQRVLDQATLESLESDQRIDLFRGQSVLVYSVIINAEGTVLRNNSPAINLDSEVLTTAINAVLASDALSLEEGDESSGKIDSANLVYRAKMQNGTISLALTDSSVINTRMQEAIFSSLALVGIALVLTITISFFLARLFLRPVEEAWTKQRRFIADASHELKTPLTVIMANTEIVRSEPSYSVESQMKWLNVTMEESERMQGLIADLLLLARMDDEQANAEKAPEEMVDFSEAVERSIFGFEAIAFERDISIEESIDKDICIKGVRSRLTRLPDILLDNACKYATESGKIKVSLKNDGTNIVFEVFNTGPKIAENDMNHLFDRFYRIDESRCDDIPGYGLGLSIAQSIVEETSGTLAVKNVPEEEGVTFIVTFPLPH